MPQLQTYVPKSLAERVAARAEARGVPVSRHLADLTRRDVELGWPNGYFDRVVGGWNGAPLRRAPQGRPVPTTSSSRLPRSPTTSR